MVNFHANLYAVVGERPFQAVFIKKNGEQRIMTCTIQEQGKVKNNILAVHDLDVNECRSINLETLLVLNIDGRLVQKVGDKWIFRKNTSLTTSFKNFAKDESPEAALAVLEDWQCALESMLEVTDHSPLVNCLLNRVNETIEIVAL